MNTPEHLYEWTSGADKAGLHVIVHAIGDRAIRTQLDIFERVEKENGPRDRRFRIEHAQHIAPADMPRFATLGVIASVQPYHAIDDGRWVEKVIGHERAQGHVRVPLPARRQGDRSRSAPTGSWRRRSRSPGSTRRSRAARSTTRIRAAGSRSRRSRVDEALRAYTAGGSFAGYAEKERGVLKTGMLADIAVIDHDLTRIAPETIRDANVVMTIVDGRIVYER